MKYKLINVLPFTTAPIPEEFQSRLISNLATQKPGDIEALRRVATETARELYPRRHLQALVAGCCVKKGCCGNHFSMALVDLN